MLIYQNLTKEILDSCYEVHRTLGSKLLEGSYEKALAYELELRGVKCECQLPISVYYKGKEVGKYYADILVQDKVVLELKCVKNLSSEDYCSNYSLYKCN